MKDNLRKAKYNERFLSEFEKLMPDDYFDWKIAVVFYIAVHYLNAYFKSHNITIRSHEHRIQEIENGDHSISEDCCDNYQNLYFLSRSARYNGFKELKDFIKHQKEKLKEAKENLKVIKGFIEEDFAQIND